MKSIREQKFLETFFLFLLSLTPLFWLKNGEIILGHDSGFFLDASERLKTYLYAWMPYEGLGVDYSLYRAFLLTLFPHAFFAFITGSLAWAQKLSFVFWFFIMAMAMYAFADWLQPKKKAWPFRVLASTFYIYNFFILQGWFIAERAKFSLYAALPLLFLILFKTQNRELSILKGGVFFALVLFFLNGGGSPPLYGFVILALLVFYFYFFIKSLFSKNFTLIKRTTLIYSFFILSAALINCYWLYPLFKYYYSAYFVELGSRGGIAGQLEWLLETSKHTSWFNLIRLQGIPSWYSKHPYSGWFVNSKLTLVISLFVPLVILAGLIKSRFLRKIKTKEKDVLIICFLFLFISLIFAAGSHPPLGFIYVFATKHLPGFAIFRNAFYKFAAGLWFSEILLFSYFVNHLTYQFKYRRYLASLVIIGILVFHYPYFGSHIFTLNSQFATKLKVPEYVYQMSDYVAQNTPKDSRILLVPPIDPKTNVDAYDWGFYSIDSLPKSALNRSVIGGGSFANLYHAIAEGDSALTSLYFNLYGIDKLLWRGDVLYPESSKTAFDFKEMKTNLEHMDFVESEYESGEWVLYGVNKVSDKIWLADKVIATNADISFALKMTKAEHPAFVDLSNYDSTLQALLLVPSCSRCNFNYGMEPDPFLFIPKIKYKPGSLKYRISHFWEQKRYTKAVSPAAKIDVLLVNLSKRVGEMHKFGREDKLKEEYQKGIVGLKQHFDELADADKIFYSSRIIEYLEAHMNYIGNEADYVSYFEPWLWETENYENIKMFVGVPNSDMYDIRGTSGQLEIEGNIITGGQVYLEEGVHKIAVSRPRPRSIISGVALNKTFQSEFDFPLSQLEPEKPYLLTFNYALQSEAPVFLMVENGSRYEEIKLINDAKAHDFSYLFSVSDRASLRFFTKIDGNKVGLQLENLELSEFSLPELYFYKDNSNSVASANLNYTMTSPVEYSVKIDAGTADQKALLIFNESYSQGWQLRGVGEAEHIKVNGFANGWVIEEPQEGELMIYYQPQDNYKLGMLVTLLALVSTIPALIIFDHLKRKSGI